MTSFNELLASALAPITLISGVGLLMLSMSARYNPRDDQDSGS